MANRHTILHGFYLSSCTWRVRAALHWKRIPYEERAVDIAREKHQLTDQYRSVNPAQKVPALVIGLVNCASMLSLIFGNKKKSQGAKSEQLGECVVLPFYMMLSCSDLWILLKDGHTLVESMAIVQYLEDTRPNPTLTPDKALQRAHRAGDLRGSIFLLFKNDARIFFLQTIVSGIQPLQNIGLKSSFSSEEEFQRFGQNFTDRGLQTLEALVSKYAGRYCVGDQLTMADLCFVPQLYNATTRLKLNIQKYPTVSRLYETLLKERLFEETHPKNFKSKI